MKYEKNCFIFKFTILYEKVKLDDKGIKDVN